MREVDVDSWIDRHVGWHLVLFLLGAGGGALVGYEAGKKWGGPEPVPESAQLRGVRTELSKLRAGEKGE